MIARSHYYPANPWRIGDFRVTAYSVDHSSFGSVAFLVETEGKRILYSGDLRLHGRKPGMARALLKATCNAHLDLLIMEGTTLSRGQQLGLSEQNVETLLVNSLKQTPVLALAMFSPQNVDRLVSFYRATARSGRVLVLDLYAAFILHLIKSECAVPDPFEGKQTRVYMTEFFTQSRAGRRLSKLIPLMKSVQISRAAILAKPGNFLMIFREWMCEQIFESKLPSGSRPFYSYWLGYLSTQHQLKEFRVRLEESGCAFEFVHASGHIYYQDIMEFIERANPLKLLPIHTTASYHLRLKFSDRMVDTPVII